MGGSYPTHVLRIIPDGDGRTYGNGHDPPSLRFGGHAERAPPMVSLPHLTLRVPSGLNPEGIILRLRSQKTLTPRPRQTFAAHHRRAGERLRRSVGRALRMSAYFIWAYNKRSLHPERSSQALPPCGVEGCFVSVHPSTTVVPTWVGTPYAQDVWLLSLNQGTGRHPERSPEHRPELVEGRARFLGESKDVVEGCSVTVHPSILRSSSGSNPEHACGELVET